ncbi:MAG: hypothetical protein RLY86_4418 [Pseudomonadota bacterium]|jgi:hypothetical protein
MTTDDFSDALDRFGPDLAAWPAELRRRAEGLLAVSPPARERMQVALALDTLLRNARPPVDPASVDLATIDRVVAASLAAVAGERADRGPGGAVIPLPPRAAAQQPVPVPPIPPAVASPVRSPANDDRPQGGFPLLRAGILSAATAAGIAIGMFTIAPRYAPDPGLLYAGLMFGGLLIHADAEGDV